LKDYSCGYLKTYSLDELPSIIQTIHNSKKKVYVSLNIISNENNINSLEQNMEYIKSLNADGYVIADFGIFQVFKEFQMTNKIIFNPVTNITNKYSTSIANNMGINHVCLANELNIKDIIEIANYNQGNIQLLAQGYYQICNSKRPLLTNFFKNFKIESDSKYFYIKEESRDYAYPIIEINGETLVFIDKERSIIKHLPEILEAKIENLRIDTIFLTKEEINQRIDIYEAVLSNKLSIEDAIKSLKSTNSNLDCLDNISILTKEKNHE
jgi:putative protease